MKIVQVTLEKCKKKRKELKLQIDKKEPNLNDCNFKIHLNSIQLRKVIKN